jgi:(p)ppGpp synthase/HD superfamily hydrolase
MAAWDPDLYNRALHFAGEAHGDQKVPGTDISYLMHLCQVCQEAMGAVIADPTLNGDLVMQCALLHDAIEDTETTRDDVAHTFGPAIADGADALSKRDQGPDGAPWSKVEKMGDSLSRIVAQPREIWVVKLADRVTNLQVPPGHWSIAKIEAYHHEAETILDTLGSASDHLAARMRTKLKAYRARWAGTPSSAT